MWVKKKPFGLDGLRCYLHSSDVNIQLGRSAAAAAAGAAAVAAPTSPTTVATRYLALSGMFKIYFILCELIP